MAMTRTNIGLPPAMAAEMATERATRLQRIVEAWLAANVPTQLRLIAMGTRSATVSIKANESTEIVVDLDREFPSTAYTPLANLVDSAGGVVSIREARVLDKKSVRVVLQGGPGGVTNKAVTVVAAGIGESR